MKFEVCPICGKKGLYSTNTHFAIRVECRYCHSHWATHKWSSVTHPDTDICPKCGYKDITGLGSVFPHYEPMPQEQIDNKIAERKRFLFSIKPKL